VNVRVKIEQEYVFLSWRKPQIDTNFCCQVSVFMDQRSALNSRQTDSRRSFLKVAGAAVAGSFFAPAILGAEDKAGTKPPILGEGAFQYEAIHNWGDVPKHIQWGETHGVCLYQASLENQNPDGCDCGLRPRR